VCTVSVVRAPWIDVERQGQMPSWRMVVNRDERRSRRTAEQPCLARHDGVDAAYPIDPDGGGTWVAASSAGLGMALLNEHEPTPAARVESRGLIIPGLLAACSLRDVESRLHRLEIGRYRPFRLLAVDETSVLEVVHDGVSVAFATHDVISRMVRTSSSVRTTDIQAARIRLFADVVRQSSRRMQDVFHGHAWHGDRAASVLMERPDARTVSQTVIEMFADHARLEYRPVPAWTPAVVSLTRGFDEQRCGSDARTGATGHGLDDQRPAG
jgi:hypothetical protein